MNEARIAVKLVERYGLSTRQALKCVIEGDADMAAQMAAKKEEPDDKKKQKELESRYKEAISKDMDGDEDDPHGDNPPAYKESPEDPMFAGGNPHEGGDMPPDDGMPHEGDEPDPDKDEMY